MFDFVCSGLFAVKRGCFFFFDYLKKQIKKNNRSSEVVRKLKKSVSMRLLSYKKRKHLTKDYEHFSDI